MPRITKELSTAEAFVETRGELAPMHAKAMAAQCAAEGLLPAARRWEAIAAWCEAICAHRFSIAESGSPHTSRAMRRAA